ncbi:hypothetical protein UFOVP833_37 [uncultured Caudovirales phage]|uniref:Uncharacterized protein n=1 Tax=uncultured Caudovirales phage TaxID=2100421 RepID=A0A6J5P1R1_9CAUD|nr:hypothetical protein UFOVP833_37 [uncultured Caudovirales phage]CAB4218733.1 hypothetical protein UFOVP1603_50 [uncultured Caudovirales phage]
MVRDAILAACCFALAMVVTSRHVRAEIDPERPDWVMIVGCALNPYPKRPHASDTAEEYRRKLDLFWEIRDCRLMLLARDAGWRAAGRPTSANAYPPLPMVRDGDYR